MRSMRGYEESLYYLGLTCRRLKEGLSLGLDPDLFEERFLDEIDFIDSVLDRIQASLLEETHLIQRKEYLHQLVLTRQLFRQTLREFRKAAAEGDSFPQKVELFDQLGQKNQERLDAVNQVLSAESEDNLAEEVITHEEMNILLGDSKPPLSR